MSTGAELVRDEKIVVEVTPDQMLGVISFEAPKNGGVLLNREAILHAINEKGITTGLLEEVLEQVINQRTYDYKYIIAKGTAPEKGEDAYLDYKFDKQKLNSFKPAQNEDGTVNFKDLNIVTNVVKGQELVVKIPATEGKAGINVLGKDIKAPKSKDVRIPHGKNTAILDDGLTLVADIEGKLCYDGHNVYISPVFIVEKDVDSSTGNINFVGNVIVNGSIKDGFKVKASGTVEVKGCVEGAEIEAGSDVVIWYGIQGMDKGAIHTKGNIIVKFIQNGNVDADGDIVTEAIMHSRVSAMNVDVTKGKGLIVGGQIIATNRITANTIGSHMATHTDIQIGIAPGVLKEYQEADKVYKKLKEEMDKISKNITFLMTKKTTIEQEKQILLNKLLTTKVNIEANYKEARSTYNALNERIRGVQNGMIKVKNKVNPGVKVTIGTAVKYIREDYTYCTIQKNGADIEIVAY